MTCYCCGSEKKFNFQKVLWKELIEEWRISDYEVEYINRQQGEHCQDCGSNLRSQALAFAIMKCFGFKGIFQDFVREKQFQSLQVLEINEACSLMQFLQQMPGHQLKTYPQLDMMNMNIADMSFDLVIHSDVLEHVEYPVTGLSECHRILKPGGYCAFTVPIVIDRLTISRVGMSPSYHGSGDNKSDYLVRTEYGCDAWKQVIQAGFQECRIFSINYPAAQAMVAVK